ncbi:MAG TPA: sulfatase [Planctomycetota bacterium]|nr:sulfatase [Planctomycetota bacterium]
MFHTRASPLFAAVCVLGVACTDSGPSSGRAKVNIVLVVVDTLRADYADPAARKADLPNLAAFAKDAVVFPSAYTHAPMTLPAHTALFSGRTPTRTGVTNNGQPVSQEVPLLSQWLEEQGYASQAAVSLATLWPFGKNQGVDRGFEHFERGESPISNAGETQREIASLLDATKARAPFFLFAHYAEPHEPYEAHGLAQCSAEIRWDGAPLETVPTSEWAVRRHELTLENGEHRLEIRSENEFKVRSLSFKTRDGQLPIRFETGALLTPVKQFVVSVANDRGTARTADAEIWLHDVPSLDELPARYRREAEAADAAFGNLVAMLKERKLYESSLIVFTSDHGEALGEHGVVGHVVNLHDEMLHVPLMIKLPKGHEGRPWLERSQQSLVRLIDVAPTVLDALGLPPLPEQEGLSLFGSGERVLLAQTSRPEAPRTLFALRDLRTKLVYDVAADKFRMYDLTADPGEERDIFDKSGAQRSAWQAELRALGAANPSMRAGPIDMDAQTRERLKSLGY